MSLIAYRGSRIAEWRQVYMKQLIDCIIEAPQDYGFDQLAGRDPHPVIMFVQAKTNEIENALKTKGISAMGISSSAWERTAVHFQIENNYGSWEKFFSGKGN